MKREKLHNHPYLEKELGLDENHVIIDRPTFERLMQKEQPSEVKLPLEFIEWLVSCLNIGSVRSEMPNYNIFKMNFQKDRNLLELFAYWETHTKHKEQPRSSSKYSTENLQKLHDKIKEAWTPDHRSFEEVNKQPQPEREESDLRPCDKCAIFKFYKDDYEKYLELKGQAIRPQPERSIDDLLTGCKHDGSYIPVDEVRRLMNEYRSQGLREVTDEMIEREFPTQIENINKADSGNLSFLQIIQRNRFRQQGVMWTRKQFTGK